MSNRTLRAMYAGMVRARVKVSDSGARTGLAGYADVACFAAGLVGLNAEDVVFGCREDGVVEAAHSRGTALPRVADATGRLYAAAGAAMTSCGGRKRVVLAFFERHEAEGPRWAKALEAVAALPLVLVVLPRCKGKEQGDLSAESRKAGVPGIAVDAADAIALYRVAQESLVRARMGGGAALIEAVRFQLDGGRAGHGADPVEMLGAYLQRRGVASERWLREAGSNGVPARGIKVGASA